MIDRRMLIAGGVALAFGGRALAQDYRPAPLAGGMLDPKGDDSGRILPPPAKDYWPYSGNVFRDGKGDWWVTFFGNDMRSPFREMPGLARIDFAADGRIAFAKDQPFAAGTFTPARILR